MRCDSPLKINNRYTGQRLTVGCRKCDSCRIASANAKALLLANELSKGYLPVFVTLTYDNEHLPVVFYGDNKIVRIGNNDNFEILQEFDDCFYFSPREPYKFPYVDCTGVIYYRDIQNFLKRLRIRLVRYGRKHGFEQDVTIRFFAVCEYGTIHKRPHAHLLLFFRREYFGKYIEECIIDSWKMCNKTVLREGIKVADGRLSSYLAAYVNSNSNHYSLAVDKIFGQKTHRSACLDYGCSKEDKEEIKRVINTGIFEYSPNDVNRPFEYVDKTKLDCFSTCFVSQRVFYTYFRKPYGFSNLSFNSFYLRARSIYYFSTRIKGRLDDLPFSYCLDEYFHQADFNFFRGYRCYLALLDKIDNDFEFEEYIFVFWRMVHLYNAMLLRRYMLSYEIKSKEDYFLDSYNTECRNVGSSVFFSNLLSDFEVTHFDIYSKETYRELKMYKFNYGKRLIPKHLSSMYNPNF